VHDLDARVGVGQLVGDLAGAVGRAVVDEHHLVGAHLAGGDEAVAGLAGGRRGAPDHGLLVPHREEQGEPFVAGGHRPTLMRCSGRWRTCR
jgi:hypothetical protein